jgi:hypothetical protein
MSHFPSAYESMIDLDIQMKAGKFQSIYKSHKPLSGDGIGKWIPIRQNA